MKIVIITQGVSRVFEPLIQSGHEVIGVIESASRGHRSPSKFRIIIASLIAVMRRQVSLKKHCCNNGIPYALFTDESKDFIRDWLKSISPDIMVVYSMSQLLTEDIFTVPRLGTINLHTSYLPDYRGPNPDFWQYVNLEMNPGVTVHFVDKGEDTGDIIAQDRCFIALGTKSSERLDQLVGDVGVRLLLKALNDLEVGDVRRVPQPKLSPTMRARNIKLSEHSKVIDWNSWSLEKIWHVLRGTESWLDAIPSPKGLLKGQRWQIEEYSHGEALNSQVPGKIYSEGKKKFVACRDGRIYITAKFKFSSFVKSFFAKWL
ncbi:MAG: methionyl-tRNA formyltransferase [Bdellovibrio sp.]|nr:methionyl-tRNA formyltransferase [Bdellovibrio sp.]